MTRPRTRLRRLIGRLGPDAYEAARAYAWSTAAGTGTDRQRRHDSTDEPAIEVLHELAETIGNEGLTDRQRVGLFVFLYREMPSYVVLMYTSHVYGDLGPEARAELWAAYRAFLSDPDERLADPIVYSLWCDYLQDDARVDAAWRALLAPPELGRRATERLAELRQTLEAAAPLRSAPGGTSSPE